MPSLSLPRCWRSVALFPSSLPPPPIDFFYRISQLPCRFALCRFHLSFGLGTERAGGPTVPPWLAAEWRARGAKLTVWADAPVKRRHGRLERRELWALADPELNGYVGSAGTVGEAWPHLQQVCRLERQRVVKGKKQVDVSYAISSLPATDADARRLLSLSRGHWGIENRLHWVRDVTFDEDRSQVRTGAAPQVLAGLRNLVISLVRRAGHSNVAAALRRHNAHLSEAFDMMGFTYQAGE